MTFAQARGAKAFAKPFGCEILFAQPENRLIFDAAWLDAPATLGNPITYPSVVGLCDALLEELELRSGLAGQVRGVLVRKLGHDTSLDSVSEQLKIPPRTLRRKLLEEGTSFREIAEQVRTQLAVKYLRDTDLSVAKLFGMIHPNADNTFTVRSVFVIGPDKKLKLTLTYPASTGRNFQEILRVIDSLQLTANYKVATPADWKHGDDVIVVPAVSNADATNLFPKGFKEIKPYLRTTPQPNI